MKDPNKILIATPIRGNQTVTLYTAGIMQSTGLHGGWLPMAGQSDVYVARNVLANEFLKRKNFDTLVMIDSDIGFTRQHLQDLIESDEDLVSGLYTDKCQPPAPFCRDNDGKPVALADIPTEGMLAARFLPGGFLKIERRVFETLIEKKAVLPYGNGAFHQFYFGRIVLDNLLSEDYSFSDLCFQNGFQGWINCGIRLNHDGRTLDAPPPQPDTATLAPKTEDLGNPTRKALNDLLKATP
jgi:hypothetical protein